MRKKEEFGVRFDWEMIDDASRLQVAQQKLWKRHLTVVENMRTHAEQLIRVAKDTIKKIDTNGIDGYYSANHDCRQWAERLHYSSHEAQILRGIRVQIDRDCGIIEQLKEISHGPQDQTAPPHPSDGRSTAPDACSGGDGEEGVLQERRGVGRQRVRPSPGAGLRGGLLKVDRPRDPALPDSRETPIRSEGRSLRIL